MYSSSCHMNHVVSQRFVKCLNKLKEDKKVPSFRQCALALDFPPQNLHDIIAGGRDVTIDLIKKSVEVFHVNTEYLFAGKGSMFAIPGKDQEVRILTVVTNQYNEEKIVHVPIPAQAGYITELAEPDFFNDLPTYSLPDYKYKAGTFRSFDIAGDSMDPTLVEGDKVICSFLEPNYWSSSLKDGHVYVVVTTCDILVKRIRNLINAQGTLELISDNQYYEPYQVPIGEVKEIWFVRTKMSTFSHVPKTTKVSPSVSEAELTYLRQLMAEQKQRNQVEKNFVDRFIPQPLQKI